MSDTTTISAEERALWLAEAQPKNIDYYEPIDFELDKRIRKLIGALEQAERLRVHDSRFWRHVDDSGNCWEWKGTKDRKGYGQFTVNKKHFFAHRWAYEALVGPIAEGMVVDHLCRNRACCNPSHMEIVTPVENVKRGEGITAQNSRKDKCQCGQPYFIAHRKDGRSYRYCRACKNEYQRRWRAA